MIRYYFIAGLIFSYIAPLIRFDFRILPPVQNNILQLSRVAQPAIVPEITEVIPEIPGMLSNVELLPQTTVKWWQQYSFADILTAVFFAGVIVMLIRFVIQFLSLASLRVCRKYKYQQYNILDVDAPIKPFSFGTRIYINPKLHETGELDEIIRHELVHVRQYHSVDIIIAAVNRSIFWWNPFAWVLNSDIRNNLEYIVDNEMLQSGINRKHYQYHLLHINQLTYINDMANYFNFSNFKKRIEMMNKEKTQPVYKMKWLLLPLVAIVILLSFNAKRAIAINIDFAGAGEIVEPKPAIVADTVEFRRNATRQEPLILIDGKKTNSSTLANMQPDDIHSFSIYRHDSITKTYGAKGKDGVVIVITKQKNEDEIVLKSKEMLDSVDIAGFVDDFSKSFIKRGSSDSFGVCLIIIDGKKSDRNELSKLRLEDIQSISVLKDKYAKEQYGDEGKNGVIVVKTKSNEIAMEIKNVKEKEVKQLMTMLKQKIDSTKVIMRWKTMLDSVKSEPLVIIDNKESNVKELENLKPEDIYSFSILKDSVAIQLFGDKGKNGVAIVKTKGNENVTEIKNVQDEKVTQLMTMPKQKTDSTKVIIRWKTMLDSVKSEPLVIIDDEESNVEELENLKQEDVYSFSILKDSVAIQLFGDKGKNGVVIVKTKQNHIILETKKILHTMDWLSMTDVKPDPLVIIDDKESSVEKLRMLKRENIVSFNILKGESATKIYGDKSKDGVILVKTK
jgi:hypothetical protein